MAHKERTLNHYAAPLLTLDSSTTLFPANPLMLGSNAVWNNDGEKMLTAGTIIFDPTALALAKTQYPTALRFPGGTLADAYHFQDGISNTSNLGSKQFLRLASLCGSIPLITTNCISDISGSHVRADIAKEAAAWVKQVNITRLSDSQGLLPRCDYWEIGNEPYLVKDPTIADAAWPVEFGARVINFQQYMKVLIDGGTGTYYGDPTIKLGLPLRSETIGALTAVVYSPWNATMSAALPYVDFVSLHNAYAPIPNQSGTFSDNDLYLAAMASTQEIALDIAATKAFTALPIFITEYNTFFIIGGASPTDPYNTSLTNALYIADLLILLAEQQVTMANHWSISNNWTYGSISRTLTKNPSFHLLTLLKDFFTGNHISLALTNSPQFANPLIGFDRGWTSNCLRASATKNGKTVRILLINKDLNYPIDVTLSNTWTNTRTVALRAQEIYDSKIFFNDPTGVYCTPVDLASGWALPHTITLKPHSIQLLTMEV